jgi:hypothetical protein
MAEKVKKSLHLNHVYALYAGVVGIENSNRTLPFQFSFELDDLKKQFFPSAEKYEKERKGLMESLGTPKEVSGTGMVFDIPAEKVAEYSAKAKELDEVVVEVEFKPFTTKYLNGVPGLQIPAGVVSVFREQGLLVE